MIWPRGATRQSIRYRYIAQLYSRRCAEDDDKICEFGRPYKSVYRRVCPIQTGFKDRLYATPGAYR